MWLAREDGVPLRKLQYAAYLCALEVREFTRWSEARRVLTLIGVSLGILSDEKNKVLAGNSTLELERILSKNVTLIGLADEAIESAGKALLFESSVFAEQAVFLAAEVVSRSKLCDIVREVLRPDPI